MNPETARLRARIFAVALAVSMIFWLPVEDTSPFAAQVLGLTGAAAFGLRIFPFLAGRPWITHAGWGLACGLAVSPLAAGLMVFKIGLHGHGGVLDFSAEEFLVVLMRTPVFAFGGILIASGIYFLTD